MPPDGVERCDVVVVGSGAGGAAAARGLAERGLEVIVVEEGDYHDARDYDTDPLVALPMLYRDGGLTFAEGKPTIPVPVGRCVGGTTVINSGTCFRTPDAVLARWRDEFGIPWATELDAEFEARRAGPARGPGRSGDRRAATPAVCREGAEALGVSHGPILRNAGDVVCCGSCPTGCRIDAKQAAHVGELPRAAAAGARVRAGARVTRVLVEERARRGGALPRRGPRRPLRGPCPRRGARRRRVRHAAAAAARRAGDAARGCRRPAPADPSGVLGRRAVRRSRCAAGTA